MCLSTCVSSGFSLRSARDPGSDWAVKGVSVLDWAAALATVAHSSTANKMSNRMLAAFRPFLVEFDNLRECRN